MPSPLAITEQHIAGALALLNDAMVLARTQPSELTREHAQRALDHYELILLSARQERLDHIRAFEAQQAQAQERDKTP